MDKRQIPAGENLRLLLQRAGERLGVRSGAALRRLALPVVMFAAGLLLSAVPVGGGTYPFGAALVCAATGLSCVACAYAGAVLGTLGLSAGGLWQVLILTGALLARFLWTVHTEKGAEKDALHQRQRWVRLFCEPRTVRNGIALAAAVSAGAVSVILGNNLYYDIFSALLGVLLYPLFCMAFQLAADPAASRERKLVGWCGVFYAATVALGMLPFPFGFGIVFAYFVTLYATYAGGMSCGIVWGLFCGLALESAYVPIYPIAALCAGLLFPVATGGAVFAAALLSMGWALGVGGVAALTDVAPELAFCSAVVAPLLTFRILPERLPRILQTAEEGEIDGVARADRQDRRYVRICRSLESLSRLLFHVSDKLRCPSPKEAEQITAAARAQHCCGCPHGALCGEDPEVNSCFDNMAHRLSTHGRVSAALVPEQLARRCHHMDSMIEVVNGAARRAAGENAASERTELFASDYAVIAQMLRETGEAQTDWARDGAAETELQRALARQGVAYAGASVYGTRHRHVYLRGLDLSDGAGAEDVRLCAQGIVGGRLSSPEFSLNGSTVSAAMHSVPRFGVRTGRYSSAGSRDDTSGDSVCSFRNNEGYYYTLVSDGMGSGREAALTSGISAVFLEKLLTAGCPMKGALEMLNCFVRGSAGECFTTVDLMEADLFTGKARFIKSGAAPSFVIRDGQLFRLHCKTVPVGIIRALDAEAITFDLQAGDTVIMMSDGVTGNYEDAPWLYDLLTEELRHADSPAAAARCIGLRAEQELGREDDVTVCVLQVDAA